MNDTNPWKLGLFVVVGILSGIGVVFWLAAQRLDPEVMLARSYFNESVEGLEVGAPIKIRGVKVGVVDEIGIAPDKRMVEVGMRLFVRSLVRLGLWESIEDARVAGEPIVPPDLRVQVVPKGITGVKFVQADFFDPETTPAPELSFDPGPNYVASAPSTLKSLEDGLMAMMSALPDTVARVSRLLDQLSGVITDLSLPQIVANLDDAVQAIRSLVAEIDSAALSEELLAFGREGRVTLERLSTLIEALEAEDGSLQRAMQGLARASGSVERAVLEARVGDTSSALREAAGSVRSGADSIGALAADGTNLPEELRQSLARLREALAHLGELAAMLERDPSALLRGRAPAGASPARAD